MRTGLRLTPVDYGPIILQFVCSFILPGSSSGTVEAQMKAVFWFVVAAAVALALLTTVGVWPYYRDIDAMVYRAQVSADAGKMADRLDETLANMEKYGVTHGYAALIFTSPENDVALDYEALKDLSLRARSISQLANTSVEYQTALDDMRGTLREISVDALYFGLIHGAGLWVDLAIWILVLVLCIREFDF